MLVIISYDVSTVDAAGKRRLRKVAKLCQNYGLRVQNSVFECDITPDQLLVLKNRLLDAYDPAGDSLRFYNLGSHFANKIDHYGVKKSFNTEDALIL